MTNTEILNLGIAIGFAGCGDIDAAIHAILPGVVVGTDKEVNSSFKEFLERDFNDADVLLEALQQLAEEHNLR